MRKIKFLSLPVLFLLLFVFACEKEDENVMGYTYSWLPITDFNAKPLNAQYTSGDKVQMSLKVKSYEDNAITKVSVYIAEINETTGEPGTLTLLKDYQSSELVYNEGYMLHELKIEYTAEEKYENKKVQLSADIFAANGDKLNRVLATFGIAEPVDYLIQGLKYFYMLDNEVDADQSAGSSCLAMVMHLYKPFLMNESEVGGTDGPAYNPDFVMGFYSASRWNTSVGVSYMFGSDAGWYGINKRLESITTGSFATIEAELTAGRPVIVYGNFRKDKTFKHAILLIGLGNTKVVVQDPAGKWDGTVNGNYTQNKTAGVYVTYTKTQIKAAIGADGAIEMNTVINAPQK